MVKVALYARYSSDNQSVASIEDQFRVCQEHAAREKWKAVDTALVQIADTVPLRSG